MPKRARTFASPSASAKKKHRASGGKTRKGYSSTARTRGAAVTGEMKYVDNGFSGALTASTNWTGTEVDPATVNTLLAPVVGAGVDQRIGKSIKVMKIKIKGNVNTASQIDQTAADGAAQIRIALYQDMQTNSTQAQGEDVMSSFGSALLNVSTFQNINNFGRFRVLKDMNFVIQNPNMTYDGTNIEQAGLLKPFKMNIVFKEPVVIRFNNTNGGTVADIIDNSFHVIAMTSNTALAPTLNYVSRVCYKE